MARKIIYSDEDYSNIIFVIPMTNKQWGYYKFIMPEGIEFIDIPLFMFINGSAKHSLLSYKNAMLSFEEKSLQRRARYRGINPEGKKFYLLMEMKDFGHGDRVYEKCIQTFYDAQIKEYNLSQRDKFFDGLTPEERVKKALKIAKHAHGVDSHGNIYRMDIYPGDCYCEEDEYVLPDVEGTIHKMNGYYYRHQPHIDYELMCMVGDDRDLRVPEVYSDRTWDEQYMKEIRELYTPLLVKHDLEIPDVRDYYGWDCAILSVRYYEEHSNEFPGLIDTSEEAAWREEEFFAKAMFEAQDKLFYNDEYDID